MKKEYVSDAMKKALEKIPGDKIASLDYFRPQKEKKTPRKKKASPRAPRGELLLDRSPVGFDLALLKQQMDLLQEGILSIHEKLSGLETSRLELQRENAKLRELSQRLPGNGGEPYEAHKLPTGVTVYRHKSSGECVCPKCFENDHAAVGIQHYCVRFSKISRCPRCQDEFSTEESVRRPVKILPPEDAAPPEAPRPNPGVEQVVDERKR